MRAYLDVLATPGAKRFSGAGMLTRLPNAMVGIALTLLISGIYKEYTLAGIVTAVATVAAAIFQPMMARQVDLYGQSKIGWRLVITFVASVIALVVTATFQWSGFVLCVFAAIGGACFFPVGSLARQRWTYVLGGKSGLQPAFALESMFDDVGFIFGPTLATAAATLAWPYFGVVPQGGAILLCILLVVGASLFLSQKSTEPPPSAGTAHASTKSVIRVPGVALVSVIFVGIGVQFGANGIAMVAVCEDLGAKWAAAPIMSVGSVASMMGALFYGARYWKMALWKRFVIGILMMTLTTLGFLVARDFVGLMIVSFLTGLAISPSFVNGNSLIERIVPASGLVEGLTWIGTALNVGNALGASVTGRVIDLLRPTYGAFAGFWVMIAGGLCAAIMALASIPTLRRRHREALSDDE